jgi:hypothetical protein
MKTIMKNYGKLASNGVVFAALLACLIVVQAGSAAAENPVLRILYGQTFTGAGMTLTGETVTISEPKAVQPAVLHWSAGYGINYPDHYSAGLSINGGPCGASVYGPGAIPDYDLGAGGNYNHVDFQWIVQPSDGVLVPGLNTFELCVGGSNDGESSDSIQIYYNTLFVQLAP